MRRLCLFLFLILSVAASSCNLQQPSTQDGGSISVRGHELYWVQEDFPLWLLIDDQLPDTHAQATFEAALLWNQAIGEQVFEPVAFNFSHVPPTDHGLVVVSMQDLGPDDHTSRRLGLARAVTRTYTHRMRSSAVWFDTELDESVLLLVIIHELGHALTLEHDNDCTSIMHPTVVNCGGRVQITPEDIHRVCNMVLGTPDVNERRLQVAFLPEVWRSLQCIR